MNIVHQAIAFANEKHHGQVRKATGAPYITHPIAVSYLVASYKQSNRLPDILAATILHDVVEDCDVQFHEVVERFGMLVGSLVWECTNDATQISKMGKLAYHKKKLVGISSWALVIKLCDRLHNITDHPTAKMIADTKELVHHLKQHRTLSSTHLRIIADIETLVN